MTPQTAVPTQAATEAAPEAPNLSALARALLTELRQRFPAFEKCLPLAIGIDKLLLAEMPEISRKTLRVALNMHTNSSRYLKAMASATARFDLAGNAAGDVTEEHRARATEMLKERFKKERDQRNAARVAEDTKRRADEALRKIEAEANARTEKLQLLAAKFSGKAGR
ncbi:MAG: ProQ/FinO family protein [Herminiimonas sp.]|nr:ProQ/FinO family protein [Herminiimonas sp.]